MTAFFTLSEMSELSDHLQQVSFLQNSLFFEIINLLKQGGQVGQVGQKLPVKDDDLRGEQE